MATISAAGSGNWSATGTWTGGVVPVAGDIAAIGTYVVVMDVPTIPVGGGNLLGITFNTGGITIDMSATGLNGNATINCGTNTITAGFSSSGSLRVAVASSANTLTVNGNVSGGGTTNDNCILVGTAYADNVVVNGNVLGGAAGAASGIYHAGTGSITVTGNVSGGTNAAHAITQGSLTPGTVTLNSCNIIDGSSGSALACVTPTWNKSTTNYYETGGVKFYYDVPDKANVRENDTVAGVTGEVLTKTLSAANDTVAAGYYAATTLHAVDADLAAGNISTGVTIFGINGSASGGGGVFMPRARQIGV
jgi:hypothetical protein